MTPYTLHHGDCLAVLRTLPDASVDAIVTDPPYGLSFMGKRWDYDVPSTDVWAECLRVLKPGGHLLAFAGTRTQHRMACRIEDAGFDIRDLIAWVYGSGFPKSLDVSKAIDREAGAERDVVGPGKWNHVKGRNDAQESCLIRPGGKHKETAPATPAARAWQGWGTALKPALEPITVARKPLDGTVAENVLAHGTGALNVDGCRVGTETLEYTAGETGGDCGKYGTRKRAENSTIVTGRWPANLIHDGSEEVVGLFPETGPSSRSPRNNGEFQSVAKGRDLPHVTHGHEDIGGSAARFFYCAKAAGDDRDAGSLGLFWRAASTSSGWEQIPEALYWTLWNENEAARRAKQRSPHVISQGNLHPTVKPTDLMRYLCRLVTPPDGVVLDPFTGSGSTGRGAILEGFSFIGMEREADYLTIARARIDDAVAMRAKETAQLTML